MKFDKNTIDYFSTSLRYNINTYVDLYSLFISDYQKKIENYYKFKDTIPDIEAFDFLYSLIDEANKIDDLIKINKKYFNKINHWEFVSFLDDIKNNLNTIQNTAKWVGSNKTKNNWRNITIQNNYVLSQHETLENVVEDNFGGDIQNDWMDLSLRNNLLERDYTIDGGNELQISKSISSNPKFFIKTVVDSLIGEKLYGLDIYKKISYEDDDLKTLSPKETIKQSINILANLRKGDVPEFPKFGVDANLGVGSDVGQLIYSSIVRQMITVFSSDDTLIDFNVLDVSYDNTNLVIDYAVDTFYNNTIKSKITI